MGIETGLGCQRIINYYLHATAQFEHATGDDGFASIQAIDHIDEITARLTQTDELLAQYLLGFAGLIVLLFFYHENRITEGCIRNRSRSHR